MSKIIEKLIVSSTAPNNPNVGWVKQKADRTKELFIHDNNSWTPIGGSNSGGGSGSGIDIVDSVDKLDPNAEAGQVAVVAVQGTGKECGFGELYQNSPESIDMSTGIIDTSKCDRVTSISIKDGVTLPSDFGGGVLLSLANPDLLSESGSVIMLSASRSSIAAIIMTGGATNYVQVYDGQTANTESVTMINNLLASDEFYYAIDAGLMEAGKATDFTILDTILQAQSGTSSTAQVFLKKDKWEELYKKDFDKLIKGLDIANASKADKISVESVDPYFKELKPNIYYTDVSNSNLGLTYTLFTPTDTTQYNEYILELRCNSAPSDIVFKDENGDTLVVKWNNDSPPTFASGSTCLISIVRGLGVYTSFVH